MIVKQDWEKVRDGVESGLKLAVSGLAQGAAADIQGFVSAISRDMTLAISSNRPELVVELKAQLLVLAETHRLRVVKVKDEQFNAIMGTTLDVIFNVATKALASLTVA